MLIDPSIYGQVKAPAPMEGPLDQYAKVQNLKTLMGQGQLQELQRTKLQRDLEEEQATHDVFRNMKPDQTLESLLPDVMRASPTKGIQFQKQILEQNAARANLDKTKLELAVKSTAAHRDQLVDVNDPASAAEWTKAGYADPNISSILAKGGSLEQALARIPTDPAQFQEWKKRNALGATKFIEMNKPHIIQENLGGTNRVSAVPGLGGAPETISTTARTVSPDAAMHDVTARRGQNMTDARARELNGIMEGQGPTDLMPTATAIANHDIPLPNPPSGSRNPMAMVRYNDLVKKVKEINPAYNAPDYAASLKGVKDFGTGPYGQKVESANTALNHLATLRGLAEAQKNGNSQLVNKFSNELGAAFGQTAPSNLKAAITMVAPEIVKAVSGAGGGVEDRAKAAGALNPNYSPDQFLGAAGTMEELFGGRLSEAKRTYERTTFRKDFEDKMLSPAAREILQKRGKAQATPAASGKTGEWSVVR